MPENSPKSQVTANIPLLVTLEKYADQAGVSLETVRGNVQKGYLPSRKVGKRVYVNMVRLHADLLEGEE